MLFTYISKEKDRFVEMVVVSLSDDDLRSNLSSKNTVLRRGWPIILRKPYHNRVNWQTINTTTLYYVPFKE